MKFDYLARRAVETDEEWRNMYDEIPFLHFEKEWEIKIVPPFGGATIRFFVHYMNKDISVYLDWFDNLGCVGEPYWEVYEYDSGADVTKFGLNETKEMMAHIKKCLEGKLTVDINIIEELANDNYCDSIPSTIVTDPNFIFEKEANK